MVSWERLKVIRVRGLEHMKHGSDNSKVLSPMWKIVSALIDQKRAKKNNCMIYWMMNLFQTKKQFAKAVNGVKERQPFESNGEDQ